MTELAKGVSKLICLIKVKAGEDGKMFGSVTAGMIADELKHQFDISLDKRKIHLEHPIRALGEHEIELHLHAEVKGTLKVRVESLTPVPRRLREPRQREQNRRMTKNTGPKSAVTANGMPKMKRLKNPKPPKSNPRPKSMARSTPKPKKLKLPKPNPRLKKQKRRPRVRKLPKPKRRKRLNKLITNQFVSTKPRKSSAAFSFSSFQSHITFFGDCEVDFAF